MKKYLFLILVLSVGCSSTDYAVPSHVPVVAKVVNENVFVTYGDGGLIITDAANDDVIGHIIPTGQMKGIDDFSIDDNLLFALDARGRNHLAVYDITNLNKPELLDGPISVVGDPFNGISARGENVVVSGGSRYLEFFRYTSDGELFGSSTFGRDRGHPDVILSENGRVAFASTDFSSPVDGSRFGIIALNLGEDLNIPTLISQAPLPNAGFTEGVTTPVGFPIQADLYNNHLLVANGGGLTVITLVDQVAFGQTSNFDLGISAVSIEADNDIAYIVGYTPDPTLLKVDITDLTNPTISETVSLDIGENVPTSVAVSNSFIYITAGEAGLLKLPR